MHTSTGPLGKGEVVSSILTGSTTTTGTSGARVKSRRAKSCRTERDLERTSAPNPHQTFTVHSAAIRAIEDHHPSESVSGHARQLWTAMGGAARDPENADEDTRGAINGCQLRLAAAIAKYKAQSVKPVNNAER